jgi:hypothetical protein
MNESSFGNEMLLMHFCLINSTGVVMLAVARMNEQDARTCVKKHLEAVL